MPGRLFLATTPAEIARLLGLPGPDEASAPRWNIAPGQEVTVITPKGFQAMRWGILPVGRVNARGRPVLETIVNARGETLFEKSAFAGCARAVVPADGWYEWTGKVGRKQPWRIARADGVPCFFASISDVWQAPGGRAVAQVATVTCAPNADVARIHDRMGAILAPEDVATWLSGSEDEAKALIRPLPEGVLRIAPAEDVDWSAP